MSDTLLGGVKLEKYLDAAVSHMEDRHVKVGFMENASYPDGTPVAAVAFWNEYGAGGIPPRPFFRSMIAKESPGWAMRLGKALKFTHGDVDQALGLMGEDIKGALQQSIIDFRDPSNAESTIAIKGFNKPLIDTGQMKDSVTYGVESGVTGD